MENLISFLIIMIIGIGGFLLFVIPSIGLWVFGIGAFLAVALGGLSTMND